VIALDDDGDLNYFLKPYDLISWFSNKLANGYIRWLKLNREAIEMDEAADAARESAIAMAEAFEAVKETAMAMAEAAEEKAIAVARSSLARSPRESVMATLQQMIRHTRRSTCFLSPLYGSRTRGL
jgi:Xaa-Pro aminopeptidase